MHSEDLQLFEINEFFFLDDKQHRLVHGITER